VMYRLCMEKTLISVKEFLVPELEPDVRKIGVRDICFVAI
jgi:hypothetical protein